MIIVFGGKAWKPTWVIIIAWVYITTNDRRLVAGCPPIRANNADNFKR